MIIWLGNFTSCLLDVGGFILSERWRKTYRRLLCQPISNRDFFEDDFWVVSFLVFKNLTKLTNPQRDGNMEIKSLWLYEICHKDQDRGREALTLKIPGPHFPTNYRVNVNWHEGFNGIFVHYLPSLRVPVDVYGWYRSDLSPTCHQSD